MSDNDQIDYKIDHIAIQTDNFDNTVRWYKDYFCCKVNWHRTWEQLPAAIQKRMPFATQLVELQTSQVRFHIFDINKKSARTSQSALQYQHFALVVDSSEKLDYLRNLWISLYQSGRYQFKKPMMPTDMIVSSNDMCCFYAVDPNALEFEVIYFPPKKTDFA